MGYDPHLWLQVVVLGQDMSARFLGSLPYLPVVDMLPAGWEL